MQEFICVPSVYFQFTNTLLVSNIDFMVNAKIPQKYLQLNLNLKLDRNFGHKKAYMY